LRCFAALSGLGVVAALMARRPPTIDLPARTG
jgi:hypothetical protein